MRWLLLLLLLSLSGCITVNTYCPDPVGGIQVTGGDTMEVSTDVEGSDFVQKETGTIDTETETEVETEVK